MSYLFTAISDEYSASTEQALKDFQYLNEMEVTDIANPNMITKLDFSDAKKAKTDFGWIYHFPCFIIERYENPISFRY